MALTQVIGTGIGASNTVTSEGGAVTTSLQQGLAKCWVRFNGTSTIAVDDSLNVGSLTDSGTGNYKVNFSNNMGNANFAHTANSNYFHALNASAGTTSNIQVSTYDDNHALLDTSRVFSVAQGDLA
tara:strand:+ start:162 stop:539 length:378 start_codon:yes stop_codon:yes gene_type:complete